MFFNSIAQSYQVHVLSNNISLLPNRLPRSHLVGPRLAIIEKCIAELHLVLARLVSYVFILQLTGVLILIYRKSNFVKWLWQLIV